MIPVSGFKEEVRKWLSNQGVTVLNPQPCFVFSEASFESGDTGLADYFTSGAWISWLGGPGISGLTGRTMLRVSRWLMLHLFV